MESNVPGFFLWKVSIDGIAGIFGKSGSLGTAGSESRMISFQNSRRMQTMKMTTSALEWFCIVRGRYVHGAMFGRALSEGIIVSSSGVINPHQVVGRFSQLIVLWATEADVARLRNNEVKLRFRGQQRQVLFQPSRGLEDKMW